MLGSLDFWHSSAQLLISFLPDMIFHCLSVWALKRGSYEQVTIAKCCHKHQVNSQCKTGSLKKRGLPECCHCLSFISDQWDIFFWLMTDCQFCLFAANGQALLAKITARINKIVPFPSTEVVPLKLLLYSYIYGKRLLARVGKYFGCCMCGTTNGESWWI